MSNKKISFIAGVSLVNRQFLSIIFISQFFFLLPGIVFAKDIPKEVGGFVLGSNVTDYPDIEYSNFLKEVVIYDWHGFHKGIISYAICDSPGEIVKIKLKYADSSKAYFKTLLKKFKKKYGKPDEWKGDSFGILHIWKWKFVDENNNRVHLILQHNTKNPNENTGNMVKLFLPDNIIREQKCFTTQCTQSISDEEKKKRQERKKSDWKYLIPK
ncbi:MAG TPA: hypothetical protein EYP35_04560 [Desulfobacterales bacterium]|nr:hypothetical protein [Desulfobacterales bacterium]HIP40205.1 hypothetical protein [Desulfocapsa sulfexigens]